MPYVLSHMREEWNVLKNWPGNCSSIIER